jgi:hypothetical protein
LLFWLCPDAGATSDFGPLVFFFLFFLFGDMREVCVFFSGLVEAFTDTFCPFVASCDIGKFRPFEMAGTTGCFFTLVTLVFGKSMLGGDVSFSLDFGAFLDLFFRLGFPTTSS